MRITKAVAEYAAEQLVQKKRAKIEKLEKEFSETVRNMYMATVPDEVKKLFDDRTSWIDNSNYVTLDGHGFSYQQIQVDPSIPCKRNNSRRLEMSTNDGSYLQKRWNKIQVLREKTDQLELQIREALYGLKNAKAVEREFPEALQYLPAHHTTAIAVNVAPLRQLLSQDDE